MVFISISIYIFNLKNIWRLLRKSLFSVSNTAIFCLKYLIILLISFASGLLLAARKNEKLNGLNCGPRNKSSVFGLNTAPAVLDNNPVIPNASWKARTFTEFSTSLKKLLVPLAFKTSSLRFLNDSLGLFKNPNPNA